MKTEAELIDTLAEHFLTGPVPKTFAELQAIPPCYCDDCAAARRLLGAELLRRLDAQGEKAKGQP